MVDYSHLGIYSDWVAEANRQQALFPEAKPGPHTQARLREALGFCSQPEIPLNVQVERAWENQGIQGEVISWWVGYGPRTQAYVLKPAGQKKPLPGIVCLHDHGGFKYFGKEKISDGPEAPPQVLVDYRAGYYGGRAYANALAREGFVVLVHDTFLWGSRKFPLETMLAADWIENPNQQAEVPPRDLTEETTRYNTAAGVHEHLVAKYCNLLSTCLAGVVSHEDRIAVNYLLSRPDVDPARTGCIGLSGGGNRSALLLATHDAISAAAIVGLMTTYSGLLDHNVVTHTWMLFPTNWSRYGDWTDIAACRAPNPLLVQYDEEDDLFTPQGMRAAHEKLGGHYQSAGDPEAYQGIFYPGPHKFDLDMQKDAFKWLKEKLA